MWSGQAVFYLSVMISMQEPPVPVLTGVPQHWSVNTFDFSTGFFLWPIPSYHTDMRAAQIISIKRNPRPILFSLAT